MTWGQIRLLAAKFAESIDLDLLDQFIAARYTRICDAAPWTALEKPGSITTSAGVAGTRALYQLPADCKILLEVNNAAGNFPMRPYTQAELNALYPGRLDVSGTAGAPLTYIYSLAEDDGSTPPRHQVELYPIPSGVAVHPLRYISIPAPFDPTNTAASPLPWIPAHVILAGVRAEALAWLGNLEGMQAMEAQFAAGIAELRKLELHRQPAAKTTEAERYAK